MTDPGTAISAVSTTHQVSASLFKWMAGSKGIKRTVVLELKQNIDLLGLWKATDADPAEVITQFSDEAFRAATLQGFNLNSLKRGKIGKASTKGVPQLERYHGWTTEKAFDNVYGKVATLRHAVALKSGKRPIRLNVRLANLQRQMIMLAIHLQR